VQDQAQELRALLADDGRKEHRQGTADKSETRAREDPENVQMIRHMG
jgi:hypothetical protein